MYNQFDTSTTAALIGYLLMRCKLPDEVYISVHLVLSNPIGQFVTTMVHLIGDCYYLLVSVSFLLSRLILLPDECNPVGVFVHMTIKAVDCIIQESRKLEFEYIHA